MSIDAAMGEGAIGRDQADLLRERIEAQEFQLRSTHSLKFSKEFVAFFVGRRKRIRINAMNEERGVTRWRTVQQITAKILTVIQSTSWSSHPADHRTYQPRER